MPSLSAILSSPITMGVYRWAVILIGLILFALALDVQTRSAFGWDFVLLLVVTGVIARHVNIKTRFNGTIGVADTFIFLALLTWGTPAGILAAVVESVASTSTIARRVQTYLFNSAVSIITVWTTGKILAYYFAEPANIAALSIGKFILAVGLMGLTHYVVSQLLIAAMQLLKMNWDEWRAWIKQYSLWSCVTFFAAALTAGLIVKVVGGITALALVVAAPIILLLYFTYETYLKNLAALQESEGRFRSSFDYSTVGMALVSPEGYWLQTNQSLQNLLGHSQDELVKLRYSELLSNADAPRIEKEIGGLLDGRSPTFQSEVQIIRSDGAVMWAVLSGSIALNAQNTVKYIILQTQDVTLRKKAEEQLLWDASHDALTGLHNRASYTANLRNALRRAKRNAKKKFAVLFLDLDGFKMVNDSLGHATGDELLKATAGRLLECVRTFDTVARLGGDEFTILLEEVEDVAQVLRVADRIQHKLSEPFEFGGQEIFIGTSIGIATSEIAYHDPGEMLRDADAAMYQAKARGKGCFVLFDNDMYATATRQLRLANDLRRAAERNEFTLHYQIIQSLEDESVQGFEALIRWQHPHYGLLMPNEFIPLAEEHGLTGEIDRWALHEAARQLRQWQNKNPDFDDLAVSVNISTKQFAQSGLFEFVQQVLRETELAPASLQLEVTESAMVKNLKNTARTLADLHKLGVSIALDDFGTGYSSLSYLHELPISTLKIDRSFVNRITDESEGSAIVRAIIVLARNLKIKVVAEGIETLEQLKNLRGMGCDCGQGYLFSRPIPAADAFKLLNAAHQYQSNSASRQRSQLRLVSGS